VLVAAAVLLSGCTASYEVNVRNRIDQPITAEMRTGNPKGQSEVVVRERIGPGDRKRVGPVRLGSLERVFLSVDFEGNTGLPATTKVNRGQSAVNVYRRDEGSRGTIGLERIRP